MLFQPLPKYSVNSKMKFLTILIVLFSFTSQSTVDKTFSLTTENSEITYTSDFNKSNKFVIDFSKARSLNEQNIYIRLESNNLNSILSLWYSDRRTVNDSHEIGTLTGNSLLIIGSGLFDGKLKKAQSTKKLYFSIENLEANVPESSSQFTLIIEQKSNVKLQMPKEYTVSSDPSIGNLNIEWEFNKTPYPHLKKVRFQANVVSHAKKWRMSSLLKTEKDTFQMNGVFVKTIGGVLDASVHDICSKDVCSFNMEIKIEGVKIFNLESFVAEEVETLSIYHYESYYDKTYEPETFILYLLPFEEELRGMDLTFSVISVTGNTQLYLNAKTIPINSESYDFSMKGQLSKKMTITWEELELMKADGSDLYIGVRCVTPGEFMIKIDGHEPGFKGSLTSGVVEAGFVKMNSIINYLYMFQISESQILDLEVNLVVVTGNVDLFVLQCSDYENCMIEENDVENDRKGLFKMRNGAHEKKIKNKFNCEKSEEENVSLCRFAIGVLGKEDGASHFEISIKDEDTHLLMIPGHTVSVNLMPLQKKHLKFSFPKLNTENGKLYLSVESIWGEYSVYISKKYEFPDESKHELIETFQSPKNALYESMRIIELDPQTFSSKYIQGIYYITIESFQETSVNLKFYEKGENQISIHTLTSGKQVRGEINNMYETLYYAIPVSLTQGQAASVTVTLTPLKGHFIMLGSTNGDLPYINRYQFFSEDNVLKFDKVDGRKPTNEYLIGISLHEFYDASEKPNEEFNKEPEDSFQFLITFSYTNKPIHLTPGVMTSYTISKNNMFLIEVLDDFNDILILKSVIDGFNMKMCGHFTTTDDTNLEDKKDEKCKYLSDYKEVSLYLKKGDLLSECERVKSLSNNHSTKCYFVFNITGTPNQIFRLGFTYNERPFQIVKGELINGPYISDASGRLNFIYHGEKGKDIGILFNSKGRDLDIYTKLVRSDSVDDTFGLNFPSKNNFDMNNLTKNGYMYNVFYPAERVQEFGDNPELMVSIRPQELSNRVDKDVFDPTSNFSIQTINDVVELNRTQTFTQEIKKEKYQYFSLYNNGYNDNLKIYVMADNSTELEVLISKGIKSRPPFTITPLKTINGIASVNLDLTPEDLKIYSHQKNVSMTGHYVIAVKSKSDASISVYWNNKNDLNYIELTPNEPSTMKLDKNKKLYFTFYARDIDSGADERSVALRQNIRLYLKSTIRTNVFLVKSTTGEMLVPSEKSSEWNASIARTGGIALIDILAKDPNYCVECLYIGYIEHEGEGEITLVANVQHSQVPITLKTGVSFPEYLKPKESILFRIANPDDNIINLTTSMLTGSVDLYISRTADVSSKKNDINFSMAKGLLIHNFIQINPKEYKISGPNEWFVLAMNNKPQDSGFTLTVHKNEMQAPIETGISKFVNLSVNEFIEYFYKPKENDVFFEVRVEIYRVYKISEITEVLTTLDEFISVYEMGLSGGKIPLNPQSTSTSNNHIYFKFKIPKNNEKTFGIKVHNTSISPIELKIDLLTGNYKLLNLNEPIHGNVSTDNYVVYEAFGSAKDLLFIELKTCLGDPKVSFYQSNYTDLEFSNERTMNKMEDTDSSVFYAKMDDKNGFLKIENKDAVFSSYMLNAFLESDMNTNPYFDLNNEGNGKVKVDIEHQTINFYSIVPSNAFNEDFRHKITYKAYFAVQEEVMKYAKNCGRYKIQRAFQSPELLEGTIEKVIIGTEEQNTLKPEMLQIKFPKLKRNHKYFGVIVATVELFPNQEGYLSPTRSTKIYYDEFKVLSPRISIPYITLVCVALMGGFLFIAFIIIRDYIMGELGRIEAMGEGMSVNLSDIEEESQVGLKELNKLEKIYYHEKLKKDLEKSQSDTSNTNISDIDVELPSSSSIEEHCQEVELEEKDSSKNSIQI